MEKVEIMKLDPDAIIPTRGSDEAAGYDLYALKNTFIEEHTNALIHTGIAMSIPKGCFGAIFARSGLATKESLRPANCVGVIDSDYRGEIMVALHNDGGVQDDNAKTENVRSIEKYQRIAQIVFLPYIPVEFEEVSELSDTNRGEGGFGSTGKN